MSTRTTSGLPFDPKARSPTLTKLLKSRLAPVREKQLLAAAQSEDKPARPAPGDCCGSSCKPCVMDLYREEVKVWKECWVSWDEGGEESDKDGMDGRGDVKGPGGVGAAAAAAIVGDGVVKKELGSDMKIPGSWEW